MRRQWAYLCRVYWQHPLRNSFALIVILPVLAALMVMLIPVNLVAKALKNG